ncbi:SMI1/KNR4 family protein [Komagataeibacter sp. FNDCR1]|nr:SMI1/KNR4 family protein [Komagataeibacter sp. FNDCR1]
MIDFKARLACDIIPADPEVARQLIAELTSRMRLPDDYVTFLLKVGAFTKLVPFLVYAPGPFTEDYLEIMKIYTSNSRDYRDVKENLEDPIANGFLQIGYDSGAHPYLMSVQGDDFGSVYFVESDEFADENGDSYLPDSPGVGDAVRRHRVSTSFTGFLEGLRCNEGYLPDECQDRSAYGPEVLWANPWGVTSRHPGHEGNQTP